MSVADSAVAFVRAQIGKPYVFGSTGPDSFDCSGLCYAAYKAAGHPISRVTYTQINDGWEVHEQDLRPGDLVFPSIEHVGMYVGGGHMIAAPHTGDIVHEYNSISAFGGFWRARRIVDDAGSGVTNTGSGGNVLTGIQVQPVSILDDIGSAFGSIGNFVTELLDPHMWERIFLVIVGICLMGVGAFILAAGEM